MYMYIYVHIGIMYIYIYIYTHIWHGLIKSRHIHGPGQRSTG